MIQTRIEEKLRAALQPTHLQVENESHMHSVQKGSETHFKVVVVSEQFRGQGLLARQRLVYGALAEEMAGGVHALAMQTLTPDQWQARGEVAMESPACRGGSKADKTSG